MLADAKNRWEPIERWICDAPEISISPEFIEGRKILITGAGGSIGSTLAAEAAALQPHALVLLDASEQNLYHLDRDLKAPHHAVLGSTCDAGLLKGLFERHRPEIVFHTAAHKHVPLMEHNPFAAVRNNALGTRMLAQTAMASGTEQVVMVSTDKAVEPRSIMGASKRIAELIFLTQGSGGTRLKAVRLGNVLASEGSVLPLFQSQIDRGEAITVTHPDASRYFLGMRHAARLLMLALDPEYPAGLLVPELGSPVRIEEIAQRMLQSAESTLPIAFTGLRPGDKLTEKLLSSREHPVEDASGPLQAIHSSSVDLDILEAALNEVERAISERDLAQLLGVVSRLVPDYQPSTVIQSALEESSAIR